SPMRIFADSAPLNPAEAMSASNTTCSSVSNLGQVRLGIRDKQVFGLCAVDCVAESPAADRFDAFAMSALRPLRGQTGAALTAGRDRAHQNAIANFVSRQSFRELQCILNCFLRCLGEIGRDQNFFQTEDLRD